MRLLLLICSVILPICSFGFSNSDLELLNQGDKSFLAKNYSEAEKQYELFFEKNRIIRKYSSHDKMLYREYRKSLRQVKLLLKVNPILGFVSRAKQLEKQSKYYPAAQALQKVVNFLNRHQVKKYPYGHSLVQGKFEEKLLDLKKESLKRFSAIFLKKLAIDKKRKKSILFLEFQKDPSMKIDIGKIVSQNLITVFKQNKGFIIQDKPQKEGELIEWAKKKETDLMVRGSYRQISKDVIELEFSVYDMIKGSLLIKASVKTPASYEFFDAIEKIASDIEKNLRYYSRLEDFATIQYFKHKGNKLVKEKTELVKKIPVLRNLQQKSKALMEMFLSSVEKEKNLQAFEKALIKIDDWNKEVFNLKIKNNYWEDRYYPLIKSFILRNEDLVDYMEDKSEAVQDKDWEDYQEAHQEIVELLNKKFSLRYLRLKKFFDRIRSEWVNEYNSVLVQQKSWPKGADWTHTLKIYTGSGAFVSLSYDLSWKNFWLSPHAGYVFDPELEERKAIPTGMNLGWTVYKSKTIEPYIYAGGFYYVGLNLYENKIMGIAGAGVKAFGMIFAEGGWMFQGDGNAPVLGLGAYYAF